MRRIPTWYLIVILCMLVFGFASNILVNQLPLSSILWLNIINFTISIFWIYFNLFMLGKFSEGYERKALIFPIYFVTINTLNVLNVFLQFYTHQTVLFGFSLFTKTVELIIVILLLKRNWRLNHGTSRRRHHA